MAHTRSLHPQHVGPAPGRSAPAHKKDLSARFSRRGTSYLFFLGTALLVTIIGLSAMMVLRVKLRAAEGLGDRATAKLYAQSAVDAALLAIYSDRTWRTSITHDTWVAEQTFGDGSLTYKLVDEADGDLSADTNAPVRVYGKGVCRESVWIYSVLVQPPLESLPSNVIVNGDFETSVAAPWQAVGGCELEVRDGGEHVHSGEWGMKVKNRTDSAAVPQQTLPIILQSGATCRTDLWLKMKDDPEDVSVGLWIVTDSGSEYFEFAQAEIWKEWTHVSGSVAPTWSGAFVEAIFTVGTTVSDQEFYVEDVSVTQMPGSFGPLPGTWRREAE